MVADLAIDVLRRHAPDLLLVHFLCADSHQHLYGPRSPEAYWAIAYIDGLIGRLLAALGADGLDRTQRGRRLGSRLPAGVARGAAQRAAAAARAPAAGRRRRGRRRRGAVRHESWRRLGLHRAAAATASGLARDLRRRAGGAGGRRRRCGRPRRTPSSACRRRPRTRGPATSCWKRRPASCSSDEMRGRRRARPARATAAPTASDRRTTTTARCSSPPVAASSAAGTLGPITSRDVAPTLTALLDLPPAPAEGRALTEILGLDPAAGWAIRR